MAAASPSCSSPRSRGAAPGPTVHPYRQGVLDTAFTLFGQDSLAVMWKDTSGLPEAELAGLGFRKIAGCDLIYRHSALRTPFGDAHPTGQEADVVADEEHEAWVRREWKRFEGVAGG
jgi:hypothetical protein